MNKKQHKNLILTVYKRGFWAGVLLTMILVCIILTIAYNVAMNY